MFLFACRSKEGLVSGGLWKGENDEEFLKHLLEKYNSKAPLWTHPMTDRDRVRLVKGLELLGGDNPANPLENPLLAALDRMLTAALRKHQQFIK